MKQKQIRTVNEALHRASLAIGGAKEHGATIGLKQNTAESVGVDRKALLEARDEFDKAQAELLKRRTELKATVVLTIVFVTLVRDFLKLHLGRKYSTAWDAAGFRGSLEIPRDIGSLKVLLEQIVAYFTANAAHQNQEAKITAVRARESVNQLIAEENGVNLQMTVARQALAERNVCYKTLCRRLSGQAWELGQLLPRTDVRYLAFGLNIPAAESTPDEPANVIATVMAPDKILVKWDEAPRADYYRVSMRIAGVHEEFVPIGTAKDPDFMIEELPPNVEVEIGVSAVNRGGESALSHFRMVK